MKEVRIETKLQNKGHYVPGMISGNTLYISGQLPVHHETGAPMAGGIAQQTKDALHNVELVLKAAGSKRKMSFFAGSISRTSLTGIRSMRYTARFLGITSPRA